jgi:DNA-directed RNA polymerase specialized sigma24 family protein
MVSLFKVDEWPLAATELYVEHAEALSACLTRRFPSLDPAAIYDAVVGAVLDIGLRIDELDAPDDLYGLLFVAALRKLLCFLRSQASRHGRERETGRKSVVQRQAATREQWEQLAGRELLERVFRTIPQNDEERVVLELWGASFQEIASALGWQNLPEEEQRQRVKTVRNRVGKRLERFVEELNG